MTKTSRRGWCLSFCKQFGRLQWNKLQPIDYRDYVWEPQHSTAHTDRQTTTLSRRLLQVGSHFCLARVSSFHTVSGLLRHSALATFACSPYRWPFIHPNVHFIPTGLSVSRLVSSWLCWWGQISGGGGRTTTTTTVVVASNWFPPEMRRQNLTHSSQLDSAIHLD